ncbi:MAG: DUF2225 domain-containing protein [Methylocystaceae bacterium]
MVDIIKLARSGSVRKYTPDEVFFFEGETGTEMFIVLAGKVHVYTNGVEGFPISICKLGPGDFFGEMSLLEGLPRSASIQALEESTVIVINSQNFSTVMAEQPDMALRIMKGLSGRIRQLNDDIKKIKMEHKELLQAETETVNKPATAPLPIHSSLFLEGHKAYNITAGSIDDNYLFDRKVTCPVCGQVFETKMLRSSKLRVKNIDADFRQHFVDVEPLWYAVWSCPYCYYSNLNFDYNQVTEAQKKLVMAGMSDIRAKFPFKFTAPRTMDQVMASYYLNLQTLQFMKVDQVRLAKIWLRLAWLYQDAGDEQLSLVATDKALAGFSDGYYNSRRDSGVEQDQRLCCLMGEMALRLNKMEDALKHFRNAVVRRGGNEAVNRTAQDRIMDLKKLVREAEDAEEAAAAADPV